MFIVLTNLSGQQILINASLIQVIFPLQGATTIHILGQERPKAVRETIEEIYEMVRNAK